MLIVALPGAGTLPARLAQRIGCGWSELALHRFPDGEALVRLQVPVQGRCVVLAGSLQHPDEKTLPLVFAADAARELGADRVGLVAPYLAYMRQDHRFRAGEAVSSRSYARLLSRAVDFLVTVDPHLHRWRSLDEIYPIRTHAAAAAPLIAAWVQRHVANPLLVGPDEESAQWVAGVAELTAAPWTVMTKRRAGDREVAVHLPAGGGWSGRTPVLLDDIVSTGQTLVAAAGALRAASLAPPVCIVVHALLAADAQRRLADAGITRLVSCDSVPHASNAIELAPLLAKAVLAMAHVTAPAAPGPPRMPERG